MRFAILGAGSFGTALALRCAAGDHPVTLWGRSEALVQCLESSRENRDYLPGYELPSSIKVTHDLAEAISTASAVVLAVPSGAFQQVSTAVKQAIDELGGDEDTRWYISATKGVAADENAVSKGGNGFLFMSQILERELYALNRVGVLSGPNLADEMAAGEFTGMVISSRNPDIVAGLRDALAQERLRVYGNTDVFGTELGGAIKNIYAIMFGVADTMSVGDNTRGLLFTRSIAEVQRLAAAVGANPSTLQGLSGIGDLLTTCLSPKSRNHQLGELIAKGHTVSEAMEQLGQTAEGFNTIRVLFPICERLRVDMPILEMLHRILFDGVDVSDAAIELMTRAPRDTD